MKTIFSLLFAVIPLMSHAQTAPKEKDMSKTDSMTFTRDTSVIEEQRRDGKHADDFQKSFPAMKIDPQTMTAMKTTAEFRLDDQPLLWFAADKSNAVLDERCFGELTMVNVTTLAKDGKITLGQLKEPGRKLTPRAVAWFLMRAGVVQTFVHLEATVHLDSEKHEGSRYEAVFSGKHLFYTNERHESAFRFRFIIEEDGTMRVEV
ncbi:hypothetical protein [Prosthecobacter sp.]|uniref:hypothetical protein n=1 Tax=Prosthecobacter sp. TaxID=1965333 RepID=UPI002ABA1209|nr:hypothetical protein [Prosthecobacter sp.]MDZ4401904.1 hypothetical protein [Prosthecobacter sp.]